MADSYIDNNSGSKKKYLIPLVVLMICAVSLTGAGYAYSNNTASLDVDGNTMDSEYLSLDFKDGAASTYFSTAAVEVVDFYDHIKYSGSATPVCDLSWAPADSKAAAADVLVDTLNLHIDAGDAATSDVADSGKMAAKTLKITFTPSKTEIIADTLDLADVVDKFVIKVTVGSTVISKDFSTYDSTDGQTQSYSIDLAEADSISQDVTVTVTAHVTSGNMTFGDDGELTDAFDGVKAAKTTAAAFETITYDLAFELLEAAASS